ncbi:uncharacterized protein [Argopecten irradians]|uniref:uncharacterized protein n=1 Tax=Argopecten irradians TaxID=31199 RepID=UPI003723E2F6
MAEEGCRVYAGNLSFETEEYSLRKSFAMYGNVVDCKLITDRDTGRSRGFGFITFDTPEAANAAVEGGSFELDNRAVKVSIAQARSDSRGGGGGGGRGRGGFSRGGGDRGYSGGGFQQRDSYGSGGGGRSGYNRDGGYGSEGGAYGGGNRGGDNYGRQGGGW